MTEIEQLKMELEKLTSRIKELENKEKSKIETPEPKKKNVNHVFKRIYAEKLLEEMESDSPSLAKIKDLLDNGADTSVQDKYGRTLLMRATHYGYDIVKLLLEAGANVNAKSSGPNALFEDSTALIWAAEEGQPDIVKLLLDAGAEVNAQDIYGNTPLSRAASSGHTSIIDMLLDAGADVNSVLNRTNLDLKIKNFILSYPERAALRNENVEERDQEQETDSDYDTFER